MSRVYRVYRHTKKRRRRHKFVNGYCICVSDDLDMYMLVDFLFRVNQSKGKNHFDGDMSKMRSNELLPRSKGGSPFINGAGV